MQISIGNVHVVESLNENKPAVFFIHGWPQDWSTWKMIMELAQKDVYSVAIDLPGIGLSNFQPCPSSKKDIAQAINELIDALGLEDFTLVGHDIGGQVVFSYLTLYPEKVMSAVIMDVVVPGLKPWDQVISNPYIWHFKFHAIPNLPETLVAGKQKPYFDYFYNTISANPQIINSNARESYVKAYSELSALTAGFGWYRAFEQDIKDNKAFIAKQQSIDTPVLYVRGDHESGNIEQYVQGFKEAGIRDIQMSIIKESGHFTLEEQPVATWQRIKSFIDIQASK